MSGAGDQFRDRGHYTVIPRTLVFLRHGDDILLLRGAATKRLWAGRYNGLGGHVETDETIEEAAVREVAEEAGLAREDLTDFALRALINLAGAPRGVLLCVFTGRSRRREVRGSGEGTPEWVPLSRLGEIDLVDGDRLVRRLLQDDGLLFGQRGPGDDTSDFFRERTI